MSRADERHDITIKEYIASIDDHVTRSDAMLLFEMMSKTSGEEPILYGVGTIGFGVFRYTYDSGRKGESHILGFYPRKGKITVYLTDGTTRYTSLLTTLGKHTITGYCIYIKKLDDIDISVLEQILKQSYDNMILKSKDGPVTKILWQTEK